MVPIDTEIDAIRREIENLKINTDNKILSLNRTLAQLTERNQDLVTPGNPAPRHFTGHTDSCRKKIFIGDRVKFLTSGKFDSTEGHVSGYTRSRIFATDYLNREIPRAAKNVKIILG